MYCERCGSQSPTNSKFCGICGYPIPQKNNASAPTFENHQPISDSENSMPLSKKEEQVSTNKFKKEIGKAFSLLEQEINSTNKKPKKIRHNFRELVILLFFPIIPAFVLSIIYELPWLLFLAILVLGWTFFLTLYVYDLLDNMIASIKRSSSLSHIPKALRIIAWHIFIPAIAALIVSIVYQATIFIIICAILIFVDFFFTMFMLCTD